MPTTNLHPPIRFYRCVSVITAMLDCIYLMLIFVSKLISLCCRGVIIKACDMHCETQFKQQLCKRGNKAQTIWVIAVEVCPYLPYVIFLILIAVGWIIWLQCALWETLLLLSDRQMVQKENVGLKQTVRLKVLQKSNCLTYFITLF